MKTKNLILFLSAMALSVITAGAQTGTSNATGKGATNAAVTEDELLKYATAMDSVNRMTESLKSEITEMVNGSGTVSATRFNDLSKVINDEAKLTELNATPEEISFVKQVVAKKDEETARINQAFQSLAREYVGAATFNKVKKALTNDPDLKSRYDELMTELSQRNN